MYIVLLLTASSLSPLTSTIPLLDTHPPPHSCSFVTTLLTPTTNTHVIPRTHHSHCSLSPIFVLLPPAAKCVGSCPLSQQVERERETHPDTFCRGTCITCRVTVLHSEGSTRGQPSTRRHPPQSEMWHHIRHHNPRQTA